MSSVTLLGVVQTVCGEIGLPVPSTVVGSTTQQIKQLVAFANVVGDSLRDEANWPVLRKSATITTISGTAGYTVSLASGGNTYTCSRIIQETGWDSTNHWYFVGSVNDADWMQWQNGVMTTPIRKIWRTTSDSTIEVFPTPDTNGDTFALAFVTDLWAVTAAAAPAAALSLDADTHLFNDRLFLLGLKWRFLEAKGLPFGAPKAEYDRIIGVRKAAARPQRTLSLDRRGVGRHLVDYRNVPDTGFGA